MQLSLAQVQLATQARFEDRRPDDAAADWSQLSTKRVSGWSIDSRTCAAGDLFIAIKGERVDGHAFVDEVLTRGAVAAIVNEALAGGPLLRVDDTINALQRLAHWARRDWGRPVVAVTGSAGKTSTKDIIAEMLAVRFRVAKTTGNFNNHIGLPLTLLRIPDDSEVAVVEMGMNHSGEVRVLAGIAEPQFGVVTNVGFAHVENFDSIEGVAAAKRELIEALPASGTAILNADDERVARFAQSHAGRSITYGFTESADVRATDVTVNSQGAAFTVAGVPFHSHLGGKHGVANVLAGIAVAGVFGVQPKDLVETVARLTPGKMRGERRHWQGATILNDAYNSNPEAARNMIDVLSQEPALRRIAVLGEMLELGHMAEKLHRDLGAYVAHAGIDLLVAIHGVARSMVDAARKEGLSKDAALFFDTSESAGEFLRDFVRPGDAILFKGSRGTHVELALARMEA